MRVVISRAAGDVLSPEVLIEPLAVLESVGVKRAQQYLYDEGFNKFNYELTLPYRGEVYPTDIISVHDASVGGSFVGRCVGHTISIHKDNDVLFATSTISVERSEVE